jgi:hypothetical protein
MEHHSGVTLSSFDIGEVNMCLVKLHFDQNGKMSVLAKEKLNLRKRKRNGDYVKSQTLLESVTRLVEYFQSDSGKVYLDCDEPLVENQAAAKQRFKCLATSLTTLLAWEGLPVAVCNAMDRYRYFNIYSQVYAQRKRNSIKTCEELMAREGIPESEWKTPGKLDDIADAILQGYVYYKMHYSK